MSRIGKKIIAIGEKTEVKFVSGSLTVKGPKGEITKVFKPEIDIKIGDQEITLTPANDSIESRALWGTYASHISNMVKGVNELFVEKLILEGIGYKGEVAGDTLTLNLGFSHPVKIKIPTDIKVLVEKGIFTFTGHDKEKVSQMAASIRALKKPEPYKGKGFHYDGEIIRRKQGKKSV
ncbi:MAG: 50S ribosomal protein L6 [bacterium]